MINKTSSNLLLFFSTRNYAPNSHNRIKHIDLKSTVQKTNKNPKKTSEAVHGPDLAQASCARGLGQPNTGPVPSAATINETTRSKGTVDLHIDGPRAVSPSRHSADTSDATEKMISMVCSPRGFVGPDSV